MKRTVPKTRDIFPADMLARGNQELKDVPDCELVEAYERMRDEETGADHSFPNIRRLFGSALEREKDRREIRSLAKNSDGEMQQWYENARNQPCLWWLDHHLVAKNALKSCIACGVCTAQCPAAEFFPEYNPRTIIDVALARDEDRIVALLKSETLWLCAQCGSCKPKCPRENNLMGLISSLRYLAQLKGYHLSSVRGRQQYGMRHLCGGNLWNRAFTLYFRNVDPDHHPDFGPRYAQFHARAEEQMVRLGAHPDRSGPFGGRKTPPQTMSEFRACLAEGGTLVLWNQLEEWAAQDAKNTGVSIDEYHDLVRREG